MRKILFALAIGLALTAHAEVNMSGAILGNAATPQAAYTVAPGVLHTPQYMPNYPTAATIWPRVVEVECEQSLTGLTCDSFEWQPKYGRGEYLFITPVIKKVQPPAKIIEKTIIKEVLYKKIPQ